MLGHYGYDGLTDNARWLGRFHWEVRLCWKKWLSRCGGPPLNWDSYARLLGRYPLPAPRVVHSTYAAKATT